MRALLFLLCLAGCSGLSWNTELADHPQVRAAMLASIEPGVTTERRFKTQWGNPTQRIREGAQIAYVYRNMSNPPGYHLPQFGSSTSYVVVLFQYGLAVGGYSSDTEGCRGTFTPRPPGAHFSNPSTVKPANCGVFSRSGSGVSGSIGAQSDIPINSGEKRPPDHYTAQPLSSDGEGAQQGKYN